MAPHHWGAVAMAEDVLLYGKDPRLRRIAQEIIVTQKDEMDAMSLVVENSRPSPGYM
jgi:uncharacterized protein (DUF305 family)